ncbi:substrate-binding domain-containing protein [Saccharopolyspora sp. K220]|uniref:substrate-binding domain-containing protein n=1 Tax=Saccharopolyspora soli TaxID=2926618 RepID=UPI001F55D7BC|nr:substrate-binding domain-containing protein [Saccharopolyspora soli]MCI2417424.1 substrate-binding domain-containing protein [Saccharopolyspora soli]
MGRKGGIGIRELAAELGMSISTVSRAMNSRAEVSAETRARVRAAAERLGYQPNHSGRTLRRGITGTVALVMQTNTARTEMGETFYFSLCNGLQQVLATQSLDLMLLPVGPSTDPDQFLVNAVDRHVADAFIISNTRPADRRVEFLAERAVPFVTLGRGGTAEHAWLDLDFEGVAAQSVERLLALGHERIALASDDRDINSTSEFIHGYRRTLAEHDVPVEHTWEIRVPDSPEGGAMLAEHLLEMPVCPTAVVLAQETLALGLYRRLHRAGVRPGRDLAVVGFRKNPVCEYLEPSLTSFEVSLEDYGKRLGEIVLDQLSPSGRGECGRQEVWSMAVAPGDSDSYSPRTTRRLMSGSTTAAR